ncbi:translocation/assembly module TamB domain-containing protein [Ottowia sp.]|uniref:translocation/assembly module TamB domain-containing protein n=3 Tax=Ottowia sp. TaxID=1898956 RepID=UPI002C3E1FF6|nr:translocation/assembly module TamB domain-containing protein [Ottowia sp.]HOB67627.1 translocation/assembly module TamB domain-containing protein [Ottowia sp.]HQD47791.1 translocation/assembly module TamB domain-containing protein [Ottowia sp.]
MPRPRGRWWRVPLWSLAFLLAVLLLALGGVWVWTGTDGSLATALRWAGAQQSLVTDEVTGTVRGGGKVRRLVWEKEGLRVEVHDAELQWTPAALLTRTLQIDQLAASRIVIDDQRAPGEPSAGPPESFALPLHIRVKALRAGELRWAGPPPYTLSDVAGRFDYDGARHLLELDSARIEGGSYRLRAAATAHAPIRVDVALAGALTAPVPGAAAPVPLTLQATLRGPLTEMAAQADLQAAAAAPGASAPAIPALPPLTGFAAAPATAASAPPPAAPMASASAPASAADIPEAHATARITPWAAQPLPEAHARLRAVDVGAIWAEAPRTHLSGRLDITPLPGTAGWAVDADLANRAAGPWDQRQLPVDQLRADVTWQDNVATVRALKAQVGGGTVESTGRWANAPAAQTGSGTWQIDTRITGVNPARLHTQMSAFPLDGTATVSGEGAAIDFDVALQGREQRAAAPARRGESAAEALARDLRALRLRDAAATGRWLDGLLTLNTLRVRTDDAQLAGNARLRPAADALGGSADLTLTAPGATASVKGELQPTTGAGTLRASIADAARALAWAQKLPGADALASARARGSATLDGSWRGGWRDPTLQARLAAPSLDWLAPGSAAGTPPVQLRGFEATANGRLAQAQLAANGRVTQGERQLDVRLAASGGRTTPNAPLAASAWKFNLGQLQAGVRDPALGAGTWQLASRAAVPLQWSPAQGGQFEAGAGELTITSPAPTSQALVAWGPVRWRGGELTTTGRLTGLPLQWVERVAGSQMQDAGLTGNIVFNGDWDATLGQQLRVSANLVRASGDVTVLTTDAETGVQSRVAAGLRDARLTLRSEGNALNLKLVWDSERAGNIDGQLRTELAATRGAGGGTRWSWPETAPLQGQVQARLPQISAWSVLAPPGWRLRGALAADARIAGTRATPLVNGTVAADDVALRSVVDGIEFADGRLRGRLDGTRLLIDEFVLRGAGEQGAGGMLRATGEAGLVDGRPQARLAATLDKLRASVRDDRQVTVSGNVQAALDGRAISANGRLRVDRALIVLPDENRPTLGDDVIVRGPDGKIMYGKEGPGAVARPTSAAGQQAAQQQARSDAARARTEASVKSGDTEPLTAKVDVQVDLGDNFRVTGMGIDTRLAGVLTLTGNGPLTTPPSLRGRVQTVGGTFRAYGQQLIIQRGTITFGGEISNPTLDIIALRPNYTSDQRAGVQVMGTALLPRVRLYSEPALPDNQTLAWLLLGRPAPDTGSEAAMLQTAALALLGGREGRGLASRFGLDELSFTGGAGSGGVSDASVTLGKRLSDKLYAAYEHSLAGTGGTLMIFYELSRRWTLRGQAGANQAIDLIYRLSFD